VISSVLAPSSCRATWRDNSSCFTGRGPEPSQVVRVSGQVGKCRAVLEIPEDGAPVTEVGPGYGVARQTVHEWLTRFAVGGLAGAGGRVLAAGVVPASGAGFGGGAGRGPTAGASGLGPSLER
jgi:hypothetical protein